jgi:peptidoglycan/LPS O-acetylase OafA/YrhL
VAAGERVRRLPWPWLALLAALPVPLLIVTRGSAWTVNHYYWVDLALGPAIGLLLVSVATRRPAPLVRLLDTGPVRGLGSFSYSLYLTHAPIVVIVHEKIVAPRTGVPAFLLTLALAVPASLLVARLFAAVFELPFTRNRTWPALRAAMRARLGRTPRTLPDPTLPDPTPPGPDVPGTAVPETVVRVEPPAPGTEPDPTPSA